MLFTRHDLRKVSNSRDTISLFAILTRNLSYDKIEVLYLDCQKGTRREQTRFYCVDIAITYFEKKIIGGDSRFLESWRKHLKTLQSVKKL